MPKYSAAHGTIKLKQSFDARAQLRRRLVAIWIEYATDRLFDLVALVWHYSTLLRVPECCVRAVEPVDASQQASGAVVASVSLFPSASSGGRIRPPPRQPTFPSEACRRQRRDGAANPRSNSSSDWL